MRSKWNGIHKGWGNLPVCGRKFCGRCGRWRLLVDFKPYRKGGVTRPYSYCDPCRRDIARERYKRITPEQRDRKRESGRFRADRLRREQGVPVREFKNRRSIIDQIEGERLDPTPLLVEMRWYLAYHQMTWADLSKASGVSERTLGRLRSGESKHVRIDAADHIAHAMGLTVESIYRPYEEQEAA